MSERERFRREDPARTAPARRMSGAFRSSSRAAAGAAPKPSANQAATGESEGSCREVIERTVRIGYEVVDAQIQRGREVAEQLGAQASAGGESIGGDLRQVTETMLRSFGELTSGWLNLTATLMNSAGGAGRSAEGTQNGDGRQASGSGGAVVALEIESKRPVVVTVKASASAGKRSLAAHPLQAPEPGKASLTRVSFAPGQNGHDLSVRIRVPDDQPAGVYSGAIYNLGTGAAEGTLTVELRD